jgi:hypothetical protein
VVQPIVIRRDAFGEGQPRRDLWVSPGHALFIDGVLIQAEKLINGCTVEQPACKTVEYWHIELETHDIVLAEGLPAETYLDTGNRTAFENGGAFLELHPDFRPRHWRDTCAKLVLEGPQIVAVRDALQTRAMADGFRWTSDADLHVIADGERIDPVWFAPDHLAFGLRQPASRITLQSRAFVPAHTHADSDDVRRLGVCVSALTIDGTELDLHDPSHFRKGWHKPEGDRQGQSWRWTNGTTLLGARLRLIDLRLTNAGVYCVRPAQARPTKPRARRASSQR